MISPVRRIDNVLGQAPGVDETAVLSERSLFCASNQAIPDYLREVYDWAYLNRRNARLLDDDLIVAALLWGNSRVLRRAVLSELAAGDNVLQAAHVYGQLSPAIARKVGSTGRLEVIDVAPLQVALCRLKLKSYPNARATTSNATSVEKNKYDAAVCFFLLHELPVAYKRSVVDSLLACVVPGGKVIFIDYHKPAPWHPLRGIMRKIFQSLEPFAEEMWHNKISDFASKPDAYTWHTETYFGGLYHKTVAVVSRPK